ncbi:MAG: hypothetical protein KBC95_01935 [Candidatus Peribacteraceae bacterium]|nr:hypothetical protein [Candidatus Peribacteraceae bacterium]
MTTPANPVISSGPSLQMLLAALGDGSSVTFVIDGESVPFRLNGMQIESGGRKIWFVNGYNTSNKHMRLYYKTDSQTGKVMTD